MPADQTPATRTSVPSWNGSGGRRPRPTSISRISAAPTVIKSAASAKPNDPKPLFAKRLAKRTRYQGIGRLAMQISPPSTASRS